MKSSLSRLGAHCAYYNSYYLHPAPTRGSNGVLLHLKAIGVSLWRLITRTLSSFDLGGNIEIHSTALVPIYWAAF